MVWLSESGSGLVGQRALALIVSKRHERYSTTTAVDIRTSADRHERAAHQRVEFQSNHQRGGGHSAPSVAHPDGKCDFSLVCDKNKRGGQLKKRRTTWADLADALAATHRPHAGYFSWETDRQVAELDILQVFEKSLKSSGEDFFSQCRSRSIGEDPPDCEAVCYTGSIAGIELTELVDPTSAKNARLGKPYTERDWQDTLVPELQRMITRKDGALPIHDKGYTEYVLLFYTDEPNLGYADAKRILSRHHFSPTRLITQSFLLFSYDPFIRQCPYVRLNVRNIITKNE